MDEQSLEYKRRKRACQKAKRAHVTLWKALSVTFLVLALLTTLAAPAAYLTDNLLASYLGLSFHKLENADASVKYEPSTLELPPEAEASGKMPTMGAQNGLTLQDVAGLAWDDPLWETLLDQLTYWDMVLLCVDNYDWCVAVASVGAPGSPVTPAQLPQEDGELTSVTYFTMGRAQGNESIQDGIFCLSVPESLLRSDFANGLRAAGVHVTVENTTQWLPRLDLYWEKQTDVATVQSLRQASRLELFGRANSMLMNGIGENTRVVITQLLPVRILHWVAAGSWILMLFFMIFWIRGRKKWKQTPAYLDWRTVKNILKAQKIAQAV